MNILSLSLLAVCIAFSSPVIADSAVWHASLAAYPEAKIVAKDMQSGALFYVESDGKSVVALKGDKALWKALIIREDNPCDLGFPVVRDLQIGKKRKVLVTFCKNAFGEIDITTGAFHYLGQN